jgi:integrase
MAKLDPAKVAAAIKASIDNPKIKKHSDGQSLYLLTRDGLGWWQYQWREGASSRSKMLGSAADMSPARARVEREGLATSRRNSIMETRRGIPGNRPAVAGIRSHPSNRWPRARSTAVAGKLFGEVVTEYLDGEAISQKEAAAYHRTLAGLATMVVADIDTPDIERHLATWADKAATWKKTLVRIEKILDVAIARKYRSGDNPARWEGLFEHLPRPKKPAVKHHAALDAADVPALMRELIALDRVDARALAFTILTAARSEETRGMKWSEIVGNIWTVPGERMKQGKEHSVPLSSAALKLLGKRGDAFVFPSRYGDKKPLGHNAMLELLQTLRPDVHVHGMRATFSGDWAAKAGYSLELREMALAHAVGDPTFRAYNRNKLIELRRPMMLAYSKFATGK